MNRPDHPFDHQSMLAVISFLAGRSADKLSCSDEGNIWTPDGSFKRHLFPDSDPEEDVPGQLQAMLDILRNTETGLASMQKQIESGARNLQKQLETRSRDRSLDSLPDEIIMHIFELAFDHGAAFKKSIDRVTGVAKADPNHLGNTLARVNHHFHLIALRTPSLWSVVTSAQTKAARSSNFLRSKATGLHVYLLASSGRVEPEKRHSNNLEHIVAFLSHTRRWESLYIGKNWEYHHRERSQLLYETQCRLELPVLRSLTLKALSKGRKDVEFYSTWVMPNLACLTIEGNTIRAPDGTHDRVDCLIKFWGSLHHLENLRMDLSGFHFGTDLADSELECTLSTLTTLEFEATNATSHSVQLMTRTLHTPNIQKLCVTFMEENHGVLPSVLSRDYLSLRAQEYISLKELSFCLRETKHYYRPDTVDSLDAILRHLPQIEHLTVKAGGRSCQEEFYERPNSQIVRSEGCNALKALHALNRSTWFENILFFEKLEIVGRPSFSECTVHFEEMLPEDVRV